jgi:uncharacterized protein (DUF924 family)
VTHDAILDFWFWETDSRAWWNADPGFDESVRRRFGGLHARAAHGELTVWRASPRGRLAEIIVLDQFSRNLYRASARAFAQDLAALVLAQEAVSAGALPVLAPVERAFLLMPYMHSESREIHVAAETLFRLHAPADNLDFELRHKAIVDRFGRFPHRNAVLGRPSTSEELEFLELPGSAF